MTLQFQNPQLPNGCEVTSLSMLLDWAGYGVDKVALYEGYLPRQDFTDTLDGNLVGGDPELVYVGDATSELGGWYWDVDKEAAIRDECLYLAALLENLTMPEVPKFVLGPAPRFYPAMPQVPKMSMPVLYKPMSAQPTTAFQLIRDMSDVVNGKCPTCGKALYEGGHTHEVV